jgi:hypothetical protein
MAHLNVYYGQEWWFIPVIPATQKAEIRKVTV